MKPLLMKPKSVDSIDGFTNKTIGDYIFEIKFDGGSSEIKRHKDNIEITHGSNPNLQNVKYPELIPEILKNVKDGEYVCELCVFDNRNISIFKDYVKRANTDNRCKINFIKDIYPIIAVFHDITKNGNDDVTMLSLMERKELLNKNVKPNKHIQISKVYDKPNEILKKKDLLEGVVIKKRNSPYQFGKRDNWWKFRFNKEEIVKCNNYEDTKTGIVLITVDGRRINLAGDKKSSIAKKKLLEGGTIEVEISYHERTGKGFRFTSIKRIVGEEEE